MITVVAFALAAAGGAVARFGVGQVLNRPRSFAHGTLLVNVTGSFVLGVCHDLSGPAATIVGVAAIGAYTTFSSFVRDAIALAEAGRSTLAAVYVALTCAACVAAAAVGLSL